MICRSCGFANPAGFQFCGQCGQRLSDSALAQEAERRQLTVMFFDLVGSTTLSAELDPEELRDLIQLYQKECNQVVTRYGGHVAQYLGDGILVYFGYPVAHADDGSRAVGASLSILQAMASLNQRLSGRGKPRLDLRVGIHTGLVVIGEIGSKERRENLALGETPNVAARLQGLADINQVVFSEATLELVRDEFLVEDLGLHPLKGVPQPMRVFRALDWASAQEQQRLQKLRRGRVALQGRVAQMERLRQSWRDACAGKGTCLQLVGEAGIGKNRLLQELVEETQARLIWGQGSPDSKSVPWSAVATLLRSLLDAQVAGHAPVDKLLHLLRDQAPSMDPEQVIPVFSQILQIDTSQHFPPPPLSPMAMRVRILQALGDFFREMSQSRPCLLFVQNAEYSDASSLEWFEQIASSSSSLLFVSSSQQIVCNTIPALEVTRLNRQESRQVVEGLSQELGSSLEDELIDLITLRAEGVPLYLEELTLTACTKGSLTQLPGRLQDFLGAKLDQLGSAKLTAQQASVIGPRFSRKLLALLSQDRVPERVDQLVQMGVAQPVPARDELLFLQSLMHEACYQSLLKSVRQRYHGLFAQNLTQRFAAWAAQNPAVVAHHYLLSANPEEAVPYLVQSALRSLACGALEEAKEACVRGLELLASLEPDHPHQSLRLPLLTLQGSAWIGLRGYAAPEVEECYQQAYLICQAVGDSLEVYPVLAGLWVLYLVQGKLALTDELSERLMAITGETHHPFHRISLATRGQSHFWQGRLQLAREHLEQAVAHYRTNQATGQSLAFLQTEPSIASASYLAYCLMLLGDSPASDRWMAQARSWAVELDHPHTLAHTLCFEGLIYLTESKIAEALPVVLELVEVSERNAFPLWSANAQVHLGICQLAQGNLEGARTLQSGIQSGQATGAQLGSTWMMAQLAQVVAGGGDVEQAQQILEQALTRAQEYGEGWFWPELLRLRAQLAGGDESLLSQAQTLAEEQGGVWFLRRL